VKIAYLAGDPLKLWHKLWLLFTVIWVIVAALNVVAILAFGDEVAPEKALWPVVFAFVVPALAYALGWAWERFNKRNKSGSGS
jgi:hypothetical protein